MQAPEGGSGVSAWLHEQLFAELMHEVRHAPPGARLSARLRAALERLPAAERCTLLSRTREGCAPLFEAARRGAAGAVRELAALGAPLEQCGVFRVPDERTAHRVTPLWAAAVAGRLEALRALADAGADLNARSDSGSTPVRSACFMTHEDAVRELCERGADIHAPNHHGGTCLINGVQSASLTRYLLARGARVDARDAQRKTALHYAVQEHREDTARLLLAAGADPLARSRAGDDALRTAAARGAAPLVALLAPRFPPARRADALELLGATQLDELDDPAAALASWRRATMLRRAGRRRLRKRTPRGSAAALGAALGAREWRSLAELEALAGDPDAMRAQALLVAVRVLGVAHKDALFRVMYRGAADADALRPARCAELWLWALRVRVARETLLGPDASRTLAALTRLLLERGAAPPAGVALRALRVVARAAPEGQRLAALRPTCAAQAEAWERALRCAVHLALAAAAGSARERAALRVELAALVRADPRTAARESLLHLASSRLPPVRSSYFAAEGAAAAGPPATAARLLLAAGADPLARDAARRTPLHGATRDAAEALLAAGAHADAPDARGRAPPLPRALLLRHSSLACLAARALAPRPPPPRAALPATLRAFLDLHRP